MHCDKKLGLALGILLIGAVGAFFFRNETDRIAEIPELENPQAIDAQIREQDGSLPYLKDVEPVVSADGSGPENSPQQSPDRQADPTDSPRPADPDSLAGTDPPPDPIPPAPQTSESPIPLPQQNPTQTATVEPDPQQPSQALPTDLPSEGLWHRVKPGETLGGLAARYLGSSVRFMELYQANRDRLKSPNDLRVGVTIRIPNQGGQAQPAAPSNPIGERVTHESNAEPDAPVRSISADRNTPRKPATESGWFANLPCLIISPASVIMVP